MPERWEQDRTRNDDACDGLPGWVRDELRAAVHTGPAARAGVMTRVRAAGAVSGGDRDVSRRRPGRARPAWASRRGLAPIAGLAAAAGFAGVVTLGALGAPIGTLAGTAAGAAAALHDTLPAAHGDSMASTLLRDTVRMVRFVLVAPTAARLALVGDFNAWRPDSTPMVAAAESTGTWVATLALRPGAYEYAYVVDDTGWTVDPQAPRAADTGRARSVVTVPAVTR